MKHSQKDQRVIELPASNPGSTLAAAQTICNKVSTSLRAELRQLFPGLTPAQMEGLFLLANEGNFPKTGRTVFITTGINFQTMLPESKEIADYCEAAVRGAVSVKFPQPVVRPEDLADAKAAFAAFHDAQKTDDPRIIDLLTQDCHATFILSDGKEARIYALSPAAFRKELTRDLALKEGNHDVYEDLNYVQEGESVRVISNNLYAGSGKRGPSSVLFLRDHGVFKIKEIRATVPVASFPPG